MIVQVFYLLLFLLSVYSYALIDPNLTIVSAPFWEPFRNFMVNIGYHNRPTSWLIYLVLIAALFVCHTLLTRKKEKLNIMRVSLVIGLLTIISYPFLSHDLFNYMFDARILTFYGANPYSHSALQFPNDEWVRFLHWTHRTYPYGPTFLPITLIPSFLSLGKFSLSFLLFKSLYFALFLIAVYALKRIDFKYAVFFATNPLVIVEGLINNHNDFIAVALAIIGISFIFTSKQVLSRVFFLLSAGIKYMTLPVLLLGEVDNNKKRNHIASLCLTAIIWYATLEKGIYPWYFLNFFILLPYFYEIISRMNIFFFGLLVSYYPYIFLGGFNSNDRVEIKNVIICIFFAVNLIYLLEKPLLGIFRTNKTRH